MVAMVDTAAGRAWPLDGILDEPAGDMLDLIRRFDGIKGRIRPAGQALALADVRVEAPIPSPLRNIFCVGKNYHEHAHEFTRSGFDVKHLVRAICNSQAYQRSSTPAGPSDRPEVPYTAMTIKPLAPGQLFDSLATVLGSSDKGKKRPGKDRESHGHATTSSSSPAGAWWWRAPCPPAASPSGR